jgi:hypothetical protein
VLTVCENAVVERMEKRRVNVIAKFSRRKKRKNFMEILFGDNFWGILCKIEVRLGWGDNNRYKIKVKGN